MRVSCKTGRALIINYHYCVPEEGFRYPGLRGVSPAVFDSQLTSLNRICNPLSPHNIPMLPKANSDGLGYLITFDDGSRDVFKHAIPLIRKHNAPAIIFCCSLPYVEERVLNVQKSHLLQGKWGWPQFRSKFMAILDSLDERWMREDTSHLGLDRMYRYDDDDTAGFKRLLNVELPYQLVDMALDIMFEAEFGPQKEMVRHLYMTPDEIKRCRDWGIIIGLHTHTHCMLSRLTPEMQAREIDIDMSYFRDDLDLDIDFLSYPYGIRGSWDQNTKRLAAERGMQAGFTLERQIYDPLLYRDSFEIPRFDANDVFDPNGELNPHCLT